MGRVGCCPQWATPLLTSRVNWIIRLMACWMSSKLGTITCGRRNKPLVLLAHALRPSASHRPLHSPLKWGKPQLHQETAAFRTGAGGRGGEGSADCMRTFSVPAGKRVEHRTWHPFPGRGAGCSQQLWTMCWVSMKQNHWRSSPATSLTSGSELCQISRGAVLQEATAETWSRWDTACPALA